LIELMVSLAIGLIAVSAATAAYVGIAQMNRANSRQGDIQLKLSISAVLLDRFASNAGLMVNDARYAFRVTNQLAGDLHNGDGSDVSGIDGSDAKTAAMGAFKDTDVLEIMAGDPSLRQPGAVLGDVGTGAATSATLCITYLPFTMDEMTQIQSNPNVENGPLLVITNNRVDPSTRKSCLARATKLDPPSGGCSGSWNMKVDFLTTDLLPDTGGTCPLCATNGADCDGGSARIAGVDDRRRFMVYSNGAGTFGIYTQSQKSTSPTAFDPSFGTPALLVEGIEDMQISPRLNADYLSTECATPEPATSSLCWCNTPAANCASTIDIFASDTRQGGVVGANIQLTGMGLLPLDVIGRFRPASFDHAAGAVDNRFRSMMVVPIFMVNTTLGRL
jgi:hypothetical protein